jgi:type VI secretion system secreted protein Hcp
MASNIFLKLEGIEGESKDGKNPGTIEILSWNHAFHQPTSPVRSTAGAGTVEKATHSDLSFNKYLDGASHGLLKACWAGTTIKTAVLKAFRADGAVETGASTAYLEINLESVVISNYSVSGGPGDIPMENVSLNYGSVEYKYTPQKQKEGSAEAQKPAKHDLITNTIS